MDIVEIEEELQALYLNKDNNAIAALVQEYLPELNNTEVFKIGRIFCAHGDIDNFKLLLKHPTFDINRVIYTNTFATEPKAFLYKNVAMVKELMALGLNIDQKDRNGETLFTTALATVGGEEVAAYLVSLQSDEDMYHRDEKNRTKFHIAAEKGNVDILAAYLAKGFDIETLTNKITSSWDCSWYSGKNALHIACWCGQLKAVAFLLENGADPNVRVHKMNGDGRTPLLCALYMKPAFDEKGFSDADIIEIVSTRTEIVRLLINAGADPDKKYCDWTALSNFLSESKFDHNKKEIAAAYEKLAITLVTDRTDVNFVNTFSVSILQLACTATFENLCKLLLEKGADVNTRDGNNKTPLDYAISDNKEGLIKILTDAGATKDVLTTYSVYNSMKGYYWDNDKKSALAFLQENLVSYDLEANDHSFDEDKLTEAIFELGCCICGYEDIASFRLLQTHPFFDVNMVVEGNSFGTHEEARLFLNPIMLRELVALGLDVSLKNDNGDTLISLANEQAYRQRAHYEAESEYLKEKQAAGEVIAYLANSQTTEDLYQLDKQGTMAFHRAAFEGEVDMLASLLERGFDIEIPAQGNDECYAGFTYESKNALHIACRFGLPDVMAFLLKHGAKVNAVTNTGHTALFFVLDFNWEYRAIEYGWSMHFRTQGPTLKRRTEMLKTLVSEGADLNAVAGGNTPLLSLLKRFCNHNFFHNEKEEMESLASSLVELGAGINVSDYNGKTPLHFACINGLEELAKTLMKEGADLNARDNEGATPLHDALWNEYRGIATMLIKKGANGNIIANNKDTAMSIAAENGYTKIVELLLIKG